MTKTKTKNKKEQYEAYKAKSITETIDLAGEKVISSHKLQVGIT